MSGFFLSLRPRAVEALDQTAHDLRFVEDAWVSRVRADALDFVQVGADREDLWAPATDPTTGTTAALAGRIVLDDREWEAARDLPYDGGLACRHILHAFLREGKAVAQKLNGAFGLIVWQPHERRVYVVTDRMGFFPIYIWTEDDRPVLASHPDVLATHVSVHHAFDLATMAEVLVAGRAEAPHTYYRDIISLAPGTVYTWEDGARVQPEPYWHPRYQGHDRAGVKELGEELERALLAATQRRTAPLLGPTGILLSGGADSRAVLYGARDPGAVTSITFFDTPNAELHTAQRLAERVGSRHVQLPRDFEHYGRGAPRAVEITGGMWSLIDAHYTEFLPQLRALGLGTLLSGCYADYFFKGLTSNRQPRTLFGKEIPLYEFAPFSLQWYVPQGPVGPNWQGVVHERRRALYTGLDLTDDSEANRWALELRRLRPVVRESDTAGRLLLQRTLPWDPLFADNELIEVYQRVPPRLKLNGQVWEEAVRRICRSGGDIANNNTLSRIGASETEKLLWFFRGVLHRKIFRRDIDGTPLDGSASRGSWPKFNYYIQHSEVVPQLWAEANPATTEVLRRLVGTAPQALSRATWARWGSVRFMRLLTLKLWLDQRF